jgi:hypothetical protein
MKHPVLRIRKGAFVYDDKEQRQAPQAYPASAKIPLRKPRKTRSRKRRAGLTFLPLLVLAFGLLIVFQVILRSPRDRTAIAGWQLVLRATRTDDTLIVGVTFIAEQKTIVPSAAPSEAVVQVLVPETGDRMTLTGQLSRSPITLRGELPYAARMKAVEAGVSLLDAHALLRAAIR